MSNDLPMHFTIRVQREPYQECDNDVTRLPVWRDHYPTGTIPMLSPSNILQSIVGVPSAPRWRCTRDPPHLWGDPRLSVSVHKESPHLWGDLKSSVTCTWNLRTFGAIQSHQSRYSDVETHCSHHCRNRSDSAESIVKVWEETYSPQI